MANLRAYWEAGAEMHQANVGTNAPATTSVVEIRIADGVTKEEAIRRLHVAIAWVRANMAGVA